MALTQLSDNSIQDLEKSGLAPLDIDARHAGAPECAAVGIPPGSEGYVIPYYNINGRSEPFYRVKLFGHVVKYKQPRNTSNHVYFPKGFQQALKTNRQNTNQPYIVICEGEKKAAACVKVGIPAAALGGVDSWRNRSITIPKSAEVGKSYTDDSHNIKLPSGSDDISEDSMALLAKGMMDLIDYSVKEKVHIVIVYDTDGVDGTKTDVQRAAASLAFELCFRGVPYGRVHQCVLPPKGPGSKIGLDDYLLEEGDEDLQEKISAAIVKGNFPRHPNIKEYVSKRLGTRKMNRKEAQRLSFAVLADMDARGRRLYAPSEDQAYYFNYDSRKLLKADFGGQQRAIRPDTAFGKLLYQRYGLSNTDSLTVHWLDTQFHGEEPIEHVQPHRVIARPHNNEDAVRYQINDGQYVKVTADLQEPIEILDNGDEGFLFEAGQVEPITSEDLLEALDSQRERYRLGEITAADQKEDFPCWWAEVLEEVRLKEDPTDHSRIMTAILFYMSPWLYKWRGTQLPIELIVGEAGSGKSSLLEHRLNVLVGQADLKNAPESMKDWVASVTNTGAMHVTDNVHMVDKNMKQRLSDEMCRIVTERDPHVEMRKLYSNNELIKVPVNTVFAITGIQQPFHQVDLLQRAVLIELDKTTEDGERVSYDSDWVPRQMIRFGGRVHWIAHHLLVIHEFMKLAQREWNPKYQATYRLINVEQAFTLMCKVFGIEGDWISDYLSGKAEENIASGDWAMEGLESFAEYWKESGWFKRPFTAIDISEWAQQDEEYQECQQLNNARRLGRYITTHKQSIAQVTGINEQGKQSNRMMYILKH